MNDFSIVSMRTIFFGPMMLLLLLSFLIFVSFAPLCVAAAPAATVANTTTNSMSLTFACWSPGSEHACHFRTFGEIGGAFVMLDTGSSDLAFCEVPETTKASNQRRATAPNNTSDSTSAAGTQLLSQCQTYGIPPSHGWYGDTYTGDLTVGVGGDNTTIFLNHYYSVINITVGGNANFCGPTGAASIGLDSSISIGGIYGIGGLNYFVISTDIDDASWATVPTDEHCGDDQCVCPTPVLSQPSDYVETIMKDELNNQQWSISWNGQLGKESGTLAKGAAAAASIPENTPKLYLDKNSIEAVDGGGGYYQTNVTGIEVNGTSFAMNMTEYLFDSGTPYNSLPEDVYNAVNNTVYKGETASVIFTIPTVDGQKEEESTIEMMVTQELLEEGAFLPVTAGSGAILFFGLHSMRYVKTFLFHFGTNATFFQAVPRDTFIVEKLSDLNSNNNVTTTAADAEVATTTNNDATTTTTTTTTKEPTNPNLTAADTDAEVATPNNDVTPPTTTTTTTMEPTTPNSKSNNKNKTDTDTNIEAATEETKSSDGGYLCSTISTLWCSLFLFVTAVSSILW